MVPIVYRQFFVSTGLFLVPLMFSMTIAVSSVVNAQEHIVQKYGDMSFYTAEYGIESGTPENTGIVFLDGMFIFPPYQVTRHGLGIFVNTAILERPDRWLKNGDPPISVSDLKNAVNFLRAKHQEQIKKGYGYLLFSDGSRIVIDPWTVAVELCDIFEKILSSCPEEEKMTILKRKGWDHLVGDGNLQYLIRHLSVPPDFDKQLQVVRSEQFRTDRYGTNMTNPIEGGFLFRHGKYIESPYFVTRQGLAVFVNEKYVDGICTSDEIVSPSSKEGTDLSIPPTITLNTGFYDEILQEYVARKMTTIAQSAGDSTSEIALKIAMYKDLPCVKEVQITDDPEVVNLVWMDGKARKVRLIIPDRAAVMTSSERYLALAEEKQKTWETYLRAGDVIFIGEDGGRTIVGSQRSRMMLSALFDLLKSPLNPDAKVSQLKHLKMEYINMESHPGFFRDFSMPRQLENRLETLKQK